MLLKLTSAGTRPPRAALVCPAALFVGGADCDDSRRDATPATAGGSAGARKQSRHQSGDGAVGDMMGAKRSPQPGMNLGARVIHKRKKQKSIITRRSRHVMGPRRRTAPAGLRSPEQVGKLENPGGECGRRAPRCEDEARRQW